MQATKLFPHFMFILRYVDLSAKAADSLGHYSCHNTAADSNGFVALYFQEMLEALKALSVFFTENSLRTRRNLRGDIERRSLAINEEFALIFKEVKEVIRSLLLLMSSQCCGIIARKMYKIYVQ